MKGVKSYIIVIGLLFLQLFFIQTIAESKAPVSEQIRSDKTRFLVVNSYHREYVWSQETAKGFGEAMLRFGYMDTKAQINEFNKNDHLETSTTKIKRLWMDTKRKKSKNEMKKSSVTVYEEIKEFAPDLVFLGDDNAANFIGRQLLDGGIPVVFWGVNVTPVKYGLVDSVEKPGHNVTGIFQDGYYSESLHLLKNLDPSIKTFAILSDDTTTSRAHYKAIEHLHRQKKFPMELKEIVVTNSLAEWQEKALALQTSVDAFFICPFTSLKDNNSDLVPEEEVIAWYLKNISIPEATIGTKVKQGLLCAASDPGYSQGYEAVLVADDILTKGMKPATYPTRSPRRGPLMVNKNRARQLNINLTPEMGIEKYIE